MDPSIPVYLTPARDSVVARYRSEAGRREWRRLLECSDFNRFAAWRQFVARACPTLPLDYYEDVIDRVRSVLLAERKVQGREGVAA